MAGRGIGPDPGGNWGSLKVLEQRGDTAQCQEAKSGGASRSRTLGGRRARSQERRRSLGGSSGQREGTPRCSLPPALRMPELGTHSNPLPHPDAPSPPRPSKDPCSPRGAPSFYSPLPLIPSVYAAPVGRPGKGRLGAPGAQGGLGAPWAAVGGAGSFTQQCPDDPSWP